MAQHIVMLLTNVFFKYLINYINIGVKDVYYNSHANNIMLKTNV